MTAGTRRLDPALEEVIGSDARQYLTQEMDKERKSFGSSENGITKTI